jgi:hypothetical protein
MNQLSPDKKPNAPPNHKSFCLSTKPAMLPQAVTTSFSEIPFSTLLNETLKSQPCHINNQRRLEVLDNWTSACGSKPDSTSGA